MSEDFDLSDICNEKFELVEAGKDLYYQYIWRILNSDDEFFYQFFEYIRSVLLNKNDETEFRDIRRQALVHRPEALAAFLVSCMKLSEDFSINSGVSTELCLLSDRVHEALRNVWHIPVQTSVRFEGLYWNDEYGNSLYYNVLFRNVVECILDRLMPIDDSWNPLGYMTKISENLFIAFRPESDKNPQIQATCIVDREGTVHFDDQEFINSLLRTELEEDPKGEGFLEMDGGNTLDQDSLIEWCEQRIGELELVILHCLWNFSDTGEVWLYVAWSYQLEKNQFESIYGNIDDAAKAEILFVNHLREKKHYYTHLRTQTLEDIEEGIRSNMNPTQVTFH